MFFKKLKSTAKSKTKNQNLKSKNQKLKTKIQKLKPNIKVMFISKRNWDWIVWTLEIFIDAIEEEFKLEIPDIEADKIGSCSLAIKYVYISSETSVLHQGFYFFSL